MYGPSSQTFDIVVVADGRLSAAEARSFVASLRAMGQMGWTVGFIHVLGPLAAPPMQLPAAIRHLDIPGKVCLIDPNGPVTAGLVFGWHIAPFINAIHRLPVLATDARVLRIDQPVRASDGRLLVNVPNVLAHAAELMGGRPMLAPNDPVVRDDLESTGFRGLLCSDDWPPVTDTRNRPHTLGGGPTIVLGRHDANRPASWPVERSRLASLLPTVPGIVLRLLNCSDRMRQAGLASGQIQVADARMPVTDFLGTLDAYFLTCREGIKPHLDASIAEAIANGLPAVASSEFAPLLGRAGVFVRNECWAETYACLDRSILDSARRATSRLADSLTSAAFCARVRRVLSDTRRSKPGLVLRRDLRSRQRVLLVTPNGIGMGHVVRLLAVARRLDPLISPVFLTFSQAAGLIANEGHAVEYIAHHAAYGGHAERWEGTVVERLEQMLAFYDPRVVVFDGNVPYAGVVRALSAHPERIGVWIRRGMWRPHTSRDSLERGRHFYLVVEPTDYASAFDRGPTVHDRDVTLSVPPITFLDTEEAYSRDDARQRLGISADGQAALIMLGSGNNFDFEPVLALVLNMLQKRWGVRCFVARWPFSKQILGEEPDLRIFPLARYFSAFDFVISASGYNSFHELLSARIPAIFVPNQHPSMDEQEARAQWAARQGMAYCVPAIDRDRMAWAVEQLLNEDVRSVMRQRMSLLPRCNGAAAVARLISELSHARVATAAGLERSLHLARA